MTWHESARLALGAEGIAHVETGEHYLIAQCDHATLAAALRRAGVTVDALIVDAPYSERTHAGHDGGTASANRVLSWAKGREARGATKMSRGVTVKMRVDHALKHGASRRGIDYIAWDRADVEAFVFAWSDRCGWLLSLTDHVLAAEWDAACEAVGRYTFAPIACLERGSRIRLDGTGPPQWSTWLVATLQASRPSSREFLDEWHSKRWEHGLAPQGGYFGGAEKKAVTGGKPLWLMRAIVGDYSAPGDLVCDPCMGAGTTLVAAVELGRRAIGCEPDAGRFETACKRLAKARPQLRMRLDVEAVRGEQSALALGGE